MTGANSVCAPLVSVAERIGVETVSIRNWEKNIGKPGVKYMPAIIRFLGYNPLPPSDSWADRLLQCQTALRLSQKEAAWEMGVDQSTLAKWERGEREPKGAFAARAQRFLAATEASWATAAVRTARFLAAQVCPVRCCKLPKRHLLPRDRIPGSMGLRY